jgi:hypothetical protein
VNGSVLALLLVEVDVVLVGEVSLLGVVFSGVVFSSFDGEVPVEGVVAGGVVVVFGGGAVWLYPFVASAATALAGTDRAAAITSAMIAIGDLRRVRGDPVLSRPWEATESV